jgi:hypothetical protein
MWPSSLQDDELLAKGQLLDGEIGLGGKHGPGNRDDGSEDERGHLI